MLVQICSSYGYMRDAVCGWVVEWDRVNDRGTVLTYECLVVKTSFRSRTTLKQTCLITAGIVIKDSLMIKNLETQSLCYNTFLLGLAPGCIQTTWPTMGSRPILRWNVEKQHWIWNDHLHASNPRGQSFLSHLTKFNGLSKSTIKMGNTMLYFQSFMTVIKIKQTRTTLNSLILAKLQSKYEWWTSMQMFLPREGFFKKQANLDGLSLIFPLYSLLSLTSL